MIANALTVASPNDRMMGVGQRAANLDVIAHESKWQSMYRADVHPYLDHPNLTVLTGAFVTRLVLEGKTAVSVKISCQGQLHRVRASLETHR